MPRSTVPTPVAAALGLVPTVLSGVLGLPGRALLLPVRALTGTFGAIGQARQEYGQLAARGERLVARLHGDAAGQQPPEPLPAVGAAGFSRAFDQDQPPAPDGAGNGQRAAQNGNAALSSTVRTAAGPGSPGPAVVAAERPKGSRTPKAPQNSHPAPTRITGGAVPAEVSAVVEQVVERTAAVGAADPQDLPLRDYDHMTLGSLRGHLRSLDLGQLVVVRDYEKAHADRLPVLTMLDNRIAKLASTDPTIATKS